MPAAEEILSKHSVLLQALLDQVYMEPRHYDRAMIRAMLDQIQHDHPTLTQFIIQHAFERVVENSGEDTGTAMIELFLEYGASIETAYLFIKATQILEPVIHSPMLPQVHAVLRCLIEAGADPHKPCWDIYDKTPMEALGSLRNPACFQAVHHVIAELELERQLEANTAPAIAPVRRSGRL